MNYTKPSFSVPATGKSLISCDQGHAMPDKWGKCIRCGEKYEPTREEVQQFFVDYSIARMCCR